jgi:hypothetical protein
MNKAVGDDLADVRQSLSDLLEDMADEEGVELKSAKPATMLSKLIRRLHMRSSQKKVAILIDEYDAPIVKHLKDSAKADKVREALKDFYGVLKTNDEMIGHIFVTGVSRFTKTSIFSELNNLEDITLDQRFSAICGLTEADLDDLLAEHQDRTLATLVENGTMLPNSSVDDLRRLIRDWYDGYSWDGEHRVYNPWSVLKFFNQAKIGSHWYETGSPTFIRELGRSSQFSFDLSKKLPDITESDNAIDNIASINSSVLMFQAGYLTLNSGVFLAPT